MKLGINYVTVWIRDDFRRPCGNPAASVASTQRPRWIDDIVIRLLTEQQARRSVPRSAGCRAKLPQRLLQVMWRAWRSINPAVSHSLAADARPASMQSSRRLRLGRSLMYCRTVETARIYRPYDITSWVRWKLSAAPRQLRDCSACAN